MVSDEIKNLFLTSSLLENKQRNVYNIIRKLLQINCRTYENHFLILKYDKSYI